MAFAILDLPIDIIEEIIVRIPPRETPSFALTCRSLYGLSIGNFYRKISVSKAGHRNPVNNTLVESVSVMNRLLSDAQKRHGVRTLILRDLVPPFSSLEYFKLANEMLEHDYPKLDTFKFCEDSFCHSTAMAGRFFSFVQRHMHIGSVTVDGRTSGASLPLCALPCELPVINLTRARLVAIAAPLFPLLFGFAIAPKLERSPGEFGFGPFVQAAASRTFSLRKVFLWWPERTVVASEDKSEDLIVSVFDVIKVLAAVSGETLRYMGIQFPEGDHLEAIRFISERFPRLEILALLNAGPRSGATPLAISRLMRPQDLASNLPGYCCLGQPPQLAARVQDSLPSTWDEVINTFSLKLKYLVLGPREWVRCDCGAQDIDGVSKPHFKRINLKI